MSIGNLKDTGNQGNNMPWQWKMLLGQQCTCDELQAINANTDNLEFLLTSILTTLQEGTDYEAKFVVDTCDVARTVYLEVRVWDPTPAPGSWGPITYYLPGSSTPVVPPGASTPGCMQYMDPTGILAQIYNILNTRLDVNLSTRASEATLAALNAKFVNNNDIGDVTINNTSGAGAVNIQDGGNVISIDDAGGSLTVDGTVNIGTMPEVEIKNDSGNPIPVNGTVTANAGTGNFTVVQPTASNLNATVVGGTGVSRTPNFLRPTGASGTVAAGTFSMSFASVGTADATVGGITLKPGETLNFDAGAINNTLGAVAYNTTTAGAELIIITLT